MKYLLWLLTLVFLSGCTALKRDYQNLMLCKVDARGVIGSKVIADSIVYQHQLQLSCRYDRVCDGISCRIGIVPPVSYDYLEFYADEYNND